MNFVRKPQVAIIDYGMGNLFSVKHACEYASLNAEITSTKSVIMGSDAVILPGVGAFGDAINNLKSLDLIETIHEFIKSGKPFMGICLGMQLLMSESEEFGYHKGLGIINGYVKRFPVLNKKNEGIKVPQVGWNNIFLPRLKGKESFWNKSPLKNIRNGEFMYFAHSYYVIPENQDAVLSMTNYGDIEYCSAVIWKNIFACQFHPERSAYEGLKIYKDWALARILEGDKNE